MLQTANCNKERARRAGRKGEEEVGSRTASTVRERAGSGDGKEEGGQWRQRRWCENRYVAKGVHMSCD